MDLKRFEKYSDAAKSEIERLLGSKKKPSNSKLILAASLSAVVIGAAGLGFLCKLKTKFQEQESLNYSFDRAFGELKADSSEKIKALQRTVADLKAESEAALMKAQAEIDAKAKKTAVVAKKTTAKPAKKVTAASKTAKKD